MKKNLFKLLLCVGLLCFNSTNVSAAGCQLHSDSLCLDGNYADGYVEKESIMNINGKEIKWKFKQKGEEAFYLECLNPEDLIGNVHIPDEIDGYKVISIMSIMNANNMKSLSFGENIENIGEIDSNSLSLLNLKGIKSIVRLYEDGILGSNVKKIILPKEGLPLGSEGYNIINGSDITIIYENGTETIRNELMVRSVNSAKLVIPNTVKEITDLYDLKIKELVIPSSVKKFKYLVEESAWMKSSEVIEKLTVYSKDLEFENVTFSDNLTIYCYEGSTTEKYAKENGIKYEYITEDKGISSDKIFLSNSNNQTILEKTSYKVRINLDEDNFTGIVFIDGKLVDSKNYTVKSGSTILEFTKEYISTLSNGEHNVEMAFADGYVSTKFKITDNPEEVNIMKEEVKTENIEEKIDNPATGDNGYKTLILFVLNILSLIVILKKSKVLFKNSAC